MLLFDPATENFNQVLGLDSLGSIEKISGTRYFYSYHANGCADACWRSDLFYIDHFEVVRIGYIDVNVDEVKIYKLNKDGKSLLGSFNNGETVFSKYKDYKWGYINAYWHKQYKNFIFDRAGE